MLCRGRRQAGKLSTEHRVWGGHKRAGEWGAWYGRERRQGEVGSSSSSSGGAVDVGQRSLHHEGLRRRDRFASWQCSLGPETRLTYPLKLSYGNWGTVSSIGALWGTALEHEEHWFCNKNREHWIIATLRFLGALGVVMLLSSVFYDLLINTFEIINEWPSWAEKQIKCDNIT